MRKPVLWFTFLLLQLYQGANSQRVFQSLNDHWKFSECFSTDLHPAKVPGNIFTDLLFNNLISDPFYGTVEHDVQWVSQKDWKYSLSFIPDEEMLGKEQIILCFDGLDTRADVYLNGKCVARSSNMFIPLRINVSDQILRETNTIEVIFYSPVNFTDSLWKNYPVRLPDHQRVMLRKAGYHFGWDWGPALPGCGIRKPVYLEGFNTAIIDHIQLTSRPAINDTAIVDFNITIYTLHSGSIRLGIDIPGSPISHEVHELLTEEGKHTFSYVFKIPGAKLWWPNGWGEQNLYTAQCRIYNENDHLLDQKNQQFGIREIKLIQEPDQYGRSFYFTVNDQPVFIKGANYIPADFFAERTSEETYEFLIKNAAEDHLNMLRVWGGGIYENDVFYELCDQYGILVWQDFMFACAMYPFDSLFLESVKLEAQAQIVRLRNHPCIALWCGNNESDEGWHNWGWQKAFGLNSEDSLKIYNGYQLLFEDLLPRLVNELDSTRPYHPSSPATGWGRPEAYVQEDVHYWGVWWGMRPFETYISHTGRFVSEYGFQALPGIATLRQIGVSEKNGLTDQILKSHQKHPRGFETIDHYMGLYASVPEKLTDYIYISHYIQTFGISTAIEAHRRSMPYCMGTLYWQYNDCWPVVSWSGIDYYGRKKALQYHIRKLYQPVIVSIVESNGKLHFWGISDNIQPEKPLLKISCMDFSGKKLWSKKIHFKLEPGNSIKIAEIDTKKYTNQSSKIFITASIYDKNILLAEKIYYPAYPKDQILPDCRVSIQCSDIENEFCLKVSAPYLCRFVELSYENNTDMFEDNYFELLPGRPHEVKILYQPENFDCSRIQIRKLR